MAALPGHPNLDQLRHQAKDLLRAATAGDTRAVSRMREVSDRLTLAAAQLAVAREHGFASWSRLKGEVEARTHEIAQKAEAFCEASIGGRMGRAARILAATPEVAGYSFATAAVYGDAARVRGRGAAPAPPLGPIGGRRDLDAYQRPPADRPRELAAFIAITLERRESSGPPPKVRRWFLPESAMGRMPWPVPELADLRVLADFLEMDAGELAWLGDTRSLERSARDQRLRNYRYAGRPRRQGPPRVIEVPKPRLKAAQRRVLHDLLDWIPAHPAAHGFTRGRSALTHANAHAGKYVVVRLDLEDFFASIRAARVYGIYRTAGYPETVAHALTGLTTNVVPPDVWHAMPRPTDPRYLASHHRQGRRLAAPHLPQGAPTSPALANLAAFGLDRRLAGLAEVLELTYTRYADDLTFSGAPALVGHAKSLRAAIRTIAAEEGFTVNERKSTLNTRAGRQTVCGLVVNEHPNIARDEYDTLKAILHNAAHHGPESQNRATVPDFRAHLLGRIAWIESVHPGRGAKLRNRYAKITWEG
jgi:RNA-directed DNA polymerase